MTAERIGVGALPHSVEAERAVLGAILHDTEALRKVAAVLRQGDFFADAHRKIFAACLALSERKDPVDLVTLADELRRSGTLEAVGGAVALTRLVDDVPPAANISYYALIIKEKARRRAVAEACARAAERALTNGHGPSEPLEEIVADVEMALLAAREPTSASTAAPLSVGAEEFLAGKICPIEWAIERIWPAEASGIIGGPEKVGKSWLADELTLSLAIGTPFLGKYRVPRPRRVLRWEEEDSAVRTHRRASQLLAGRHRPLPRSEFLRYLVGHGLKLDQPEGLARLRAELERFRPEIVMVGNLREIHSHDENRPEMAEVRDTLRALLRDFGAAVIVLHHFRKLQEGQSRRGTQMLAGSGVMSAWAEGWIWVTPGDSEDIALLEVGSKDAPGVGRLVVQRRDLTDREPLAQDEGGQAVWPVILAEVEPKGRTEENRERVVNLLQEKPGASTAEVADGLGVTPRTAGTYLRALEGEGCLEARQVSSRHPKAWWLKALEDKS